MTADVQPVVAGDSTPCSGNSSATIITEEPNQNSRWISRPSGRVIRLLSSAPSTVVYHCAARAAPDELAAAAGVSKYQLIRLFTAVTGVPPHTYQVALRVNLARRLLERGERAIDVACLAGFADQSHLNRHFRRRLGKTPAQYAQATATGAGHARRHPTGRWIGRLPR
jgi:transcriptional regulator GlxA family with amidase domain